jgi:hypothetical protein
MDVAAHCATELALPTYIAALHSTLQNLIALTIDGNMLLTTIENFICQDVAEGRYPLPL